MDKKFYWSLNAPAFPSRGFNDFIQNEFNRLIPFDNRINQLNTVIFSITNQCDYRCKHCFEINNLQDEEHLNFEELLKIQEKLHARGTLQIQLSGGEPLKRIDDLTELVRVGKNLSEYWILTSGKDLILENALRLKKAGLVGINVSLDHFEADKHNEFRNNDKAFSRALEAVKNSKRVGLLTCLSLCATKDFISKENLFEYFELAKSIGVHFVQILEARSVGNFTDINVELEEEQIQVLNDFYVNALKKYGSDCPVLSYPGYHQRKIECMGAGERYLYIDTKGKIHACPFCQTSVSDAVDDDLEEAIHKLKTIGCQMHGQRSSGTG